MNFLNNSEVPDSEIVNHADGDNNLHEEPQQPINKTRRAITIAGLAFAGKIILDKYFPVTESRVYASTADNINENTAPIPNEITITSPYSKEIMERERDARLNKLTKQQSHFVNNHKFIFEQTHQAQALTTENANSEINMEGLNNHSPLSPIFGSAEQIQQSPLDQIKQLINQPEIGIYPRSEVAIEVKRQGGYFSINNDDLSSLSDDEKLLLDELLVATKHGSRVHASHCRVLKELGYTDDQRYMHHPKKVRFILNPNESDLNEQSRVLYYADNDDLTNITEMEMYTSSTGGAMAEMPHFVFPSIFTYEPRYLATNPGASITVISELISNFFDPALSEHVNFYFTEQNMPLEIGYLSALMEDINNLGPDEYQMVTEMVASILSSELQIRFPILNCLRDPNASDSDIDEAVKLIIALRWLLPTEKGYVRNDTINKLAQKVTNIQNFINWMRQPKSDVITACENKKVNTSEFMALGVASYDEANEYNSNLGELIFLQGGISQNEYGEYTYHIDEMPIDNWSVIFEAELIDPNTGNKVWVNISEVIPTLNMYQHTFVFVVPKKIILGSDNNMRQDLTKIRVIMNNADANLFASRIFDFKN